MNTVVSQARRSRHNRWGPAIGRSHNRRGRARQPEHCRRQGRPAQTASTAGHSSSHAFASATASNAPAGPPRLSAMVYTRHQSGVSRQVPSGQRRQQKRDDAHGDANHHRAAEEQHWPPHGPERQRQRQAEQGHSDAPVPSRAARRPAGGPASPKQTTGSVVRAPIAAPFNARSRRMLATRGDTPERAGRRLSAAATMPSSSHGRLPNRPPVQLPGAVAPAATAAGVPGTRTWMVPATGPPTERPDLVARSTPLPDSGADVGLPLRSAQHCPDGLPAAGVRAIEVR
jgi:hypothetical protein